MPCPKCGEMMVPLYGGGFRCPVCGYRAPKPKSNAKQTAVNNAFKIKEK